MLRIIASAALALALALALAAPAQAAVIANASVALDALPRDELRNILLGNKQSWDAGGRITLCVLSSGPHHEAFLDAYAGKSPAAFSTHWKKLVFTGKAGAPLIFARDEDLLAAVARTEGAIGYVADGTALPGGVKPIAMR